MLRSLIFAALLLLSLLVGTEAGQSRVQGWSSRMEKQRLRGLEVTSPPEFTSISGPSDCSWNINSTDCWSSEIAQFYNLINGTIGLTAMPITAYQQILDYSCGPCSVMNIMHYFGYLTDAQMNFQTEQSFSQQMQANPQTGTESANIVAFMQKQGWNVKTGVDGTIGLIKENVAAGIPMILEWVDWGGHYVVSSGYSAGSPDYHDDVDMLFLADSASMYNEVPSLHGWTAFNPDRFFGMWFGFSDSDTIITGNWVSMTPPGFVPKNAQQVENE